MNVLVILTAVALNAAPVALASPNEIAPFDHFRIGDRVLIDRKINMQTQFVVDDQDTAYIMTYFANHDVKMIRVSRPHQVKQAALYLGWPYILNKKGQLFAMSISRKTMLKTKWPIIRKHWLTKFPHAAGVGVAVWGLAWLNIWLHGGVDLNMEYPQPSSFGLSATTAYYVTDAVLTAWFRSHRKLDGGGNFFRQLLAEGVESVDFDQNSLDYIVRYKDRGKSSHFLSDLPPDFSKNTSCLYYLTKLANE